MRLFKPESVFNFILIVVPLFLFVILSACRILYGLQQIARKPFLVGTSAGSVMEPEEEKPVFLTYTLTDAPIPSANETADGTGKVIM